MNGQRGDSKQWSFDFDKPVNKVTIASSHNSSPRNAQVTIKPGVPQTTTISLNIHHEIAGLGRG